jgi:hypothetical protein
VPESASEGVQGCSHGEVYPGWFPLSTFAYMGGISVQVAVLWIRIRMFLGLQDPDPLVTGTDPDPSVIKQNL